MWLIEGRTDGSHEWMVAIRLGTDGLFYWANNLSRNEAIRIASEMHRYQGTHYRIRRM